MAECVICAYPFDAVERLRTYGVCGHSEICSICFMRMRALLRNFNCPSCKTLLEQVVCSGDANKKFEDFQIWGESCGPDHQYDQKSQMFFPKDYYRTRIEPLWSCKCKMCPLVKRDLKGLRIHVSSDHNLQICSLCVEHRQSFPSEHKYYTKAEYEKHLRVGDGDGSQGHPYCEFCRKRYFDKTALFTHLMQDHYSCHICAKLGVQYKYYSDYETLEEHFRGEHFLCSEPECLMKKFVVFADAIDLQAHGLQFHPCSQINRNIPVHFKVRRATDDFESAAKFDKPKSRDEDNALNSDYVQGRFDGGMGGNVVNGEWQVKLSYMPQDPRSDRERTTGGAVDLSPVVMPGAEEEEYPSLPGERLPRSGLGWGTYGGMKSKKEKENNFPTLQSAQSKASGKKIGGVVALNSKNNSVKVNWAERKSLSSEPVSAAILLHMGESAPEAGSESSRPPPVPPKSSSRNNYPDLIGGEGGVKTGGVVKSMKKENSNPSLASSWEAALTSTGLSANAAKSKKPKQKSSGLTVVKTAGVSPSISKSSSASNLSQEDVAKNLAMQQLSLDNLKPLQRTQDEFWLNPKKAPSAPATPAAEFFPNYTSGPVSPVVIAASSLPPPPPNMSEEVYPVMEKKAPVAKKDVPRPVKSAPKASNSNNDNSNSKASPQSTPVAASQPPVAVSKPTPPAPVVTTVTTIASKPAAATAKAAKGPQPVKSQQPSASVPSKTAQKTSVAAPASTTVNSNAPSWENITHDGFTVNPPKSSVGWTKMGGTSESRAKTASKQN